MLLLGSTSGISSALDPIGPVFGGKTGAGYLPGGAGPVLGPVYRLNTGVGTVTQGSQILAPNAATSYGTLPSANNGYGVSVPTSASESIGSATATLFAGTSPKFIIILALVGWLLVRK